MRIIYTYYKGMEGVEVRKGKVRRFIPYAIFKVIFIKYITMRMTSEVVDESIKSLKIGNSPAGLDRERLIERLSKPVPNEIYISNGNWLVEIIKKCLPNFEKIIMVYDEKIKQEEEVVNQKYCNSCGGKILRINNVGDKVCKCYLQSYKGNWYFNHQTGDWFEYL